MKFIYKIFILSLIVTTYLLGCASPESSEQKEINLIELAGQKHDSGKYLESVKILNEAIELDPENILAYINRAASKTKLKDIDGAIKDCEKVVELDDKNMLAHFNLGQHFETIENYEKAIEHYTYAETANRLAPKMRIIITNPDGSTNEGPDYSIALGDISYYRAMAYMKNNNYMEATIDLELCVDLDYYLDYCFCRLGECYQKMGFQKKACNYFFKSQEKGFKEADSLYAIYCI
jgi:tetratricopeptide (TPR) repeat protein